MASLTFTPVDRNPDFGRGECQTAFIVNDQTAVIAARGAGHVKSVVVGVAGTLLKLYDTPSGGTADATTQIATISLASANIGHRTLNAAFSKGLTAIVTGTNAEVSIHGQFGKTRASRYHFPVR